MKKTLSAFLLIFLSAVLAAPVPIGVFIVVMTAEEKGLSRGFDWGFNLFFAISISIPSIFSSSITYGLSSLFFSKKTTRITISLLIGLTTSFIIFFQPEKISDSFLVTIPFTLLQVWVINKSFPILKRISENVFKKNRALNP